MNRVLLTFAVVSAVVGTGCSESAARLPALGHHEVTIDTDAIVPADPAKAIDPTAPFPLFDRLQLAILRAGETVPDPMAVRDFSVNEPSFLPKGATFTIEGESGEIVRVRARLFRNASTFGGEPRPETTIEVVAELPTTPAEGAVETTIELRTEDVGVVHGTEKEPLVVNENADARVHPGTPTSSVVGTWLGAKRIACAAKMGTDEACVDGGAYWMGNPLVKGDDFVESDRQRLVVLSPYVIDTREVRVGELRNWLATQLPSMDTVVRKSPDLQSQDHFCTYTDALDPAQPDIEKQPANCVPWDVADAYCKGRGGALPTEAQFEYASSELRSALFVWGADEAPLCQAAVWGRSGLENSVIQGVGSSDCKMLGNGPATLPDLVADRGASRLTDRITIGGVEVFDLAGNLQEWVQDRYNKQDEPCWSRADTNIFVDPVCTTPGKIAGRSVRGGSWIQSREFLRAAYRTNREPNQNEGYVVGFRCVRPGT
jgi:formylglycine-generating enzyme required for sulfatase activity